MKSSVGGVLQGTLQQRTLWGSLRPWALLAALIPGCGGPASGPQSPVTRGPTVNVLQRDLEAKKELEALLLGVDGVGSTVASVRLAVPPVKLPDDKNSWLGEGVAFSLAATMAREDGVSVLERAEVALLVEELKKSQSDEVAKKGSLLGAQQVVLSNIVGQAPEFRLNVRLVDAATGVIKATNQGALRMDSWSADAERVAASLAKSMHGEQPDAKVTALPRERLETAARARELQYQGKLVDALPLYEKALQDGSDAWSFEADYVRLLNDLYLRDYAAGRAKQTMARLPRSPKTYCERARLQIEAARHQYPLNEAREGVRYAASCGDKTVIASALRVYSVAAQRKSYPLAVLAIEKAKEYLGNGSAWERCMVEDQATTLANEVGLKWTGMLETFRAQAKSCAAAGNLRMSAYHEQTLATQEWSPADRQAALTRGLALAEQVGGSVLDELMLLQATTHRDAGHLTEADALSLKVLGERLSAIVELAGGLPPIEAKLDADLLRRAGVRAAKVKQFPAEQALLIKAHRRSLAEALDHWAGRTAPESQPQADEYRAIAFELDPDGADPRHDVYGEERFVAELARAGLTADQLSREDGLPLRGEKFSLPIAAYAVENRFWGARSQPGAAETVPRLLTMLRHIAAWHASPREEARAAALETRWLLDQEKKPEAIVVASSALEKLDDAAYHKQRLLELLRDAQDADAARVTQRKAVEAAQRVGMSSWVSAMSTLVRLETPPGSDCYGGARRMADLADELVKQHGVEEAAQALESASYRVNDCLQVDGSEPAVAFLARRAEVLRLLDDPYRSLLANIDLLNGYRDSVYHVSRGYTAGNLARKTAVVGIMEQMKREARKLAEQKRFREAARVVTRLSEELPGVVELAHEGLGWAREFKASSEYPLLAALLHDQVARSTTSHVEAALHTALARDLYRSAKSWDAVGLAYGKLMRTLAYEPYISELFLACVEDMTASNNLDRCYNGLYDSQVSKLEDPNLLKPALKLARSQSASWQSFATTHRMRTYAAVASLALLTGDREGFDEWSEAVFKHYRDTNERYQVADVFSKLAPMAVEVDPRLSLRLYRQFDEEASTSSTWHASEMLEAAAAAYNQGNDEAASDFVQRAARRSPPNRSRDGYKQVAFNIGKPLSEGKWSIAVEKLRAARDVIDPRRQALFDDFTMRIAEVHLFAQEWSKALETMKPVVERVTGTVGSSRTPCFDTFVLKTQASLLMAQGRCNDGEKVRAVARDAARSCTTTTELDDWTDSLDYRDERRDNACRKRAVPVAQRVGGINFRDWPKVELMSCEAGEPSQCHDYAWRLLRGARVPVDVATGSQMLEKACQSGYKRSCVELAAFQQSGKDPKVDPEVGLKALRALCLEGAAGACPIATRALRKRDAKAARELAEKGCRASDSPSCYLLGTLGGDTSEVQKELAKK